MATPYIKICGLSTSETVETAVSAGADAIGFVFAESVRKVTPQQARELITRAPAAVETVGVFRAQPIEEVIETARIAGVSTIQFHGFAPHEHLKTAQAEGFRTLRAFGIDEYAALSENERELWSRERLLVDAVEPGGGIPFDPDGLAKRTPNGWWLLAGGLTAENVAALIDRLRPNGVDVSSGVESSRGVKSTQLIRDFIAAARSAGVQREVRVSDERDANEEIGASEEIDASEEG